MNEQLDRRNYWEIPPRPIGAIASEAATSVDSCIRRLADWGLTLPENSRLHQAREILAHAVATGALVPKHRGDDLGLRALELALDYRAIAETLPTKDIANVKRELRDSLLGPLDPPSKRRGPIQLQSQAVVRAALVLAGHLPRHPTHSPKKGISSPDLLLDNGTSALALEVKRPQERKNVLARFQDGVDQIRRYGLSGAVLIDATDALRDKPGAELMDAVWQIVEEMTHQTFETGQGHRPGMSHIMLLGAMARVAWHPEYGENLAMVQVHSASGFRVIATAPNTLADHRAKWMRALLRTGFERLDRTLEGTNSPPGSA